MLSTPSRQHSLEQYSAISGNTGLSFDTKITVVNQARGIDMEQRHAVATLQLAGQALIEIDEIADTKTAAIDVCSGMASVAFFCTQPATDAVAMECCGPFSGHSTSTHQGYAGERFTLVYS